MDIFIMAGTACLSQFKTTCSIFTVSWIFCISSRQINWKSTMVLKHWIHGLRSEVLSGVPLICFPFKISQQYNARIRKQLTHRFRPGLPENTWNKSSIISDNIICMALCRKLIFSYLPPVHYFIGFRSPTPISADNWRPYKDSSILTNS